MRWIEQIRVYCNVVFLMRGWLTSTRGKSPLSAAFVNAVLPSSVLAFKSAPFPTRTYRIEHTYKHMVLTAIPVYQTFEWTIIAQWHRCFGRFCGNYIPPLWGVCFPQQQSLILLHHSLSFPSHQHLSRLGAAKQKQKNSHGVQYYNFTSVKWKKQYQGRGNA